MVMKRYLVGYPSRGFVHNAINGKTFGTLTEARKAAYEWLGWSYGSLGIYDITHGAKRDGMYPYVGMVFLDRDADRIIKLWTENSKTYYRVYSNGKLGPQVF